MDTLRRQEHRVDRLEGDLKTTNSPRILMTASLGGVVNAACAEDEAGYCSVSSLFSAKTNSRQNAVCAYRERLQSCGSESDSACRRSLLEGY